MAARAQLCLLRRRLWLLVAAWIALARQRLWAQQPTAAALTHSFGPPLAQSVAAAVFLSGAAAMAVAAILVLTRQRLREQAPAAA